MSSTRRNDLLAALAKCIETAPGQARNELAEAVEAYALTYNRSYRDLTKGGLIGALLDQIEESAECRIERDRTGLPSKSEY